MASINEKLSYINDIKILLKKNINKINNVLTDNNTFRSYPQELFNGYLDILNNGTDALWSNLEKVSQTGTEPVLEGVETAPIKMMLNGNTIQDGTPTPDTPVEVKVVTGENVVSVSGKNFLPFANQDFTIKGVRFYCQGGDLYIDGTSTGEITTNSAAFKDNFKFTLKAGRYSVSTVKDTRVKYIKKYSDNSNLVFFGGNSWIGGFTLDVDTEVYLGIYIANGGVNNNAKQNAMLRNYQDSNDYVPYSKTDYPINLSPNMLPLNVEDWEQGGISSTNGENIENTARLRTKDYLPIEYAQSIILTANIVNANYRFVNIIWYDQNKNFLLPQSQNTAIDNNKRVTFSINTSSAKYFKLVIKNSDNISIITPEEITTIQPSLQKDYQYTEPIELCKINTYKDFPFKAINGNEYYDTLTEEQKNALNYGSWYVHKEIGKVVLDGSENGWGVDGKRYLLNNIFYAKPYTQFTEKNVFAYCNNFKWGNGSANKFVYGAFWYALEGRNLSFQIDETPNATTLADFKTWLSTHNTIVYYVLATPTEEEITNTTLIKQLEAIFKAKSIKDKTYITQTNDELPFIINANAILKNNN